MVGFAFLKETRTLRESLRGNAGSDVAGLRDRDARREAPVSI
jgi:hypothetical protein